MQLGKSSLAMEVDAGVLGGRVLAALRAERWRTAAETAMRNPTRATGRVACMLSSQTWRSEVTFTLGCETATGTLCSGVGNGWLKKRALASYSSTAASASISDFREFPSILGAEVCPALVEVAQDPAARQVQELLPCRDPMLLPSELFQDMTAPAALKACCLLRCSGPHVQAGEGGGGLQCQPELRHHWCHPELPHHCR